jgi:hypothetical protein
VEEAFVTNSKYGMLDRSQKRSDDNYDEENKDIKEFGNWPSTDFLI